MADRVKVDPAGMSALLESPDGPIAKHVLKLAVRVDRRAKQLAPVDTGRLRSSITYELGRDGRTIVARIGTNVHYAPHQEFGTRHMSAHPFLRPALDSIRNGP